MDGGGGGNVADGGGGVGGSDAAVDGVGGGRGWRPRCRWWVEEVVVVERLMCECQ